MREIARRLYEEIMPSGATGEVEGLFTDDFVNHAAPPGTPGGIDGARAQIEMLANAFSEQSYEIHHVLFDGDHAAVHCTWNATHTGDFMGIPATNRRISSRQTHLLRFAGDRISEHWAVRDDLTMLRQMGIAPG